MLLAGVHYVSQACPRVIPAPVAGITDGTVLMKQLPLGQIPP